MSSPAPELELEAALRGLVDEPAVDRLIRGLGFGPVREAMTMLESVTGVRRACVVAARAGAAVVWVQLDGELSAGRILELARLARAADGGRSHLLVVTDSEWRRVVFACHGLGGELRHLTIERESVRATDLETLAELVARPGEGGVALAVRWSRALDRSRVTAKFFAEFRSVRARVSDGWTGLPRQARADRDQLALLFLCRLMFLYFLQRRGQLAGDAAYVPNLFIRWRRRRRSGQSFYRRVLLPLFFGALNTRPERRKAAARRLGPLPYLNGGLFERTAAERRHKGLDLPDAVLTSVFDQLLDRYRFTTRDTADDVAEGTSAVGIDPEMLGRVFEGLMSSGRRGETGTYFTPALVVDRLVSAALSAHLASRLGLEPAVLEPLLSGAADMRVIGESDRERLVAALRGLRVLDPACGSGAFLLSALSRLARLRQSSEGGDPAGIRRDIVARTLHGVDVQPDAALLCALRLWLALTFARGPGSRLEPLPNLDRRIRQGDALLDPLDLTAGAAVGSPEAIAGADSGVRRAARSLGPLALRYVRAEPGRREKIQRELVAREVALARVWLGAVDERLANRVAELERRAAQRDLWGEAGEDARAAAAALPRVVSDRAELARLARRVDESGALPFFSFAVHFAESALAGFDLVLANPPWVRTHRWPASLGRLVRRRFLVCRDPGWREGARLGHSPVAAGAQVDLALLFLEKSVRMLSAGGTLGMLLPAKLLRSLYGGPARRLLLTELQLVRLEDHSLDQHSIFAADAFAAVVVGTRRSVTSVLPAAAVQVVMHRRRGGELSFTVPQPDLPLVAGDADSPWLLAPPEVGAVLRRMQNAGPPLGRTLRVRRGIFTGANDVLLIREAEPKLGGHAWIRAEGYQPEAGFTRARARARGSDYEALIEAEPLRPLLRGSDVSAWSVRPSRHVIWLHGSGEPATDPPPRLRAYLERHRERLRVRSGARPATRLGSLFRVSAEALGPKVVWHDLAETLKAAAVPASVRCTLGGTRPLVPLNTVYFIGTADDTDSLILAALFNSLPVRVFARATAERAKDARFRFFAWTIGVLPLPGGWRAGPLAAQLTALSREAHAAGGVTPDRQAELDAWVGLLYGLGPNELRVLGWFDRWLSGVDT